jgi:hypothetical protein
MLKNIKILNLIHFKFGILKKIHTFVLSIMTNKFLK